jgi:RND family efflux transporter MFP subunit
MEKVTSPNLKRLAAIIVLSGLVAGFFYFSKLQGNSRTDNIRDVSPPVTRIVAEGRIVSYPGGEVTVGTDTYGIVDEVHFVENQQVHKGEVLAVIRANDVIAELGQVQARIKEIEADISLNAQNYHRAKNLFQQGALPRQGLDQAERDMMVSRAKRETLLAEVKRIEEELAKKKIYAPINGTVVGRHVQPGQAVQPGCKILTLVDLSRLRIEGEVNEFDIAKIAVGDSVLIETEGNAGRWQGSVEEIPANVSARQLKPPDPGKPVDTRVLLVKVALAEPLPLKFGQRVELVIQK